MYVTQGVHRAAQIRGDALATIHGNRRRSWREVLARVSRYAAGLQQLGLNRGDRVAVIAGNSDLYIETYFAIAWAGGVIVPGNFRWSEPEHIYALRDCGAKLLVLDARHKHLGEALAPVCGADRVVLLDDTDGPIDPSFIRSEELITSNQPIGDQCGRNDDLFAIFYTGGTTGRPKGVMLSHRNVLSNILAVNAMTPFPPDPIFLHLPPMFHLADAGAILTVTLYAGTHVVAPAFDPIRVLSLIKSERINTALIIPTMFAMLKPYLDDPSVDVSSLKRIRYGGAGITKSMLLEAMRLFPNAEFQQGYGQTEMSPTVTVLEPRFHDSSGGKPCMRSAGRPLMGTDLRIVDEALDDRPIGQIGEIVTRGPGVMLGYWNQPELTAATIVDGWVKTGDAGYMDAAGFVYVVDRIKDMIVSGGENVYSAEVENAIQAHPRVAECAVVGVPDAKWGERVHAIVRLHEDDALTSEALILHCRSLIAGYKCPRSVEFRVEPLPLSAQGKILKAELRERFWKGQDRMVG